MNIKNISLFLGLLATTDNIMSMNTKKTPTSNAKTTSTSATNSRNSLPKVTMPATTKRYMQSIVNNANYVGKKINAGYQAGKSGVQFAVNKTGDALTGITLLNRVRPLNSTETSVLRSGNNTDFSKLPTVSQSKVRATQNRQKWIQNNIKTPTSNAIQSLTPHFIKRGERSPSTTTSQTSTTPKMTPTNTKNTNQIKNSSQPTETLLQSTEIMKNFYNELNISKDTLIKVQKEYDQKISTPTTLREKARLNKNLATAKEAVAIGEKILKDINPNLTSTSINTQTSSVNYSARNKRHTAATELETQKASLFSGAQQRSQQKTVYQAPNGKLYVSSN